MPWQNGEFVYQAEVDQLQKNKDTSDEIKSNRTGQPRLEEDQPRSNESIASLGIAAGDREMRERRMQANRETASQAIFSRVKQTPEVLSLAQAIIDDIIGPGATFHYIGREDGEGRGTESIRRARRFWERNQETYADSMRDDLFVGDMYIYKRSNQEAAVSQAVEQILNNRLNVKNKQILSYGSELLTEELKQETDMFDIKELTHVPATTIEHEINRYGDIEAFIQKVGSHEVELPRDQVMHQSFMKLNGKTYGFSPLRSLFTEIDMLANLKNHNAQIFSNAGVVNKMFILPDEGPNDTNFEMVKKTVQKYRKLKNKHRDLVLTGDIEVEDMNSIDESMEFRQLAEYISNVLAMAWGVPPSRVGTDVGGGGKRGRATQLSHEGYFKRIKRQQRRHQAFLNEYLFEPVFNVRMVLNNPDTKQEIREADRDMRRLEVTKQHVALGLWSKEKAMNYLNINRNELNEFFDEEDFIDAAREISGLQDEVLDDQTVNEDTAETAERMDIREGVNENLDSPEMRENVDED